jgi:hypothetical protein
LLYCQARKQLVAAASLIVIVAGETSVTQTSVNLLAQLTLTAQGTEMYV